MFLGLTDSEGGGIVAAALAGKGTKLITCQTIYVDAGLHIVG